MAARNRFVKVRLSPAEYADVRTRADFDGLTMCEHIRQQLLAVHEQLDLRAELAALRGHIATPHKPAGEEFAAEAVLLLRELLAGRDAQALGRVGQRLDSLYSNQRRKL
ncbi:hypothetical protein PQR12_11595 [Paraburkholderia nemoris]|uniref:hypothetical protein n=1 Tax=Paraburkholderia nemoris TaxID=2793076 RepID=UPI0038B743EA